MCATALGDQPHVLGLLVCFMLNAILVVVFHHPSATTCASAMRAWPPRQRAAEEHIVRMGLLASGAAHELGTPLATLAVILGDWKRVPALTRRMVLQEEIAEMEAQVKRCKTIVSGILMSAGGARRIVQPDHRAPVSGHPGAELARHALGGHLRLRQPAGATAPWWPMPPWSKWFSMCWTMPGCIAALGALAGAVRCRMRCESWSPIGARLFNRRAPATSARPTSPQRAAGGGLGCSCR